MVAGECGRGDCDPACQKHLYLQRQLRESLGKGKDRVDWVWLINDNAPATRRPHARPAASHCLAGRARCPQGLAGARPRSQQLADHLYVVDPMGNWMMRFPAAMDTSGAAKAKRDLDAAACGLLRGTSRAAGPAMTETQPLYDLALCSS